MNENMGIKAWARNHKGMAILLIIIIFFIVGVLTKNSGQSSPTVSTSDQNSALKSESTGAPVEDWRKIISLDVDRKTQSEIFHLAGGQQKLVYKGTGDKYLICYIYLVPKGQSIDDPEGGFPEVTIDEPKTDEIVIKKNAGDYYLDVRTVNGTCAVELQELQ